eukprot:scaffold28550_cov35-Tisochrysis_lutea.AAC.3
MEERGAKRFTKSIREKLRHAIAKERGIGRGCHPYVLQSLPLVQRQGVVERSIRGALRGAILSRAIFIPAPSRALVAPVTASSSGFSRVFRSSAGRPS